MPFSHFSPREVIIFYCCGLFIDIIGEPNIMKFRLFIRVIVSDCPSKYIKIYFFVLNWCFQDVRELKTWSSIIYERQRCAFFQKKKKYFTPFSYNDFALFLLSYAVAPNFTQHVHFSFMPTKNFCRLIFWYKKKNKANIIDRLISYRKKWKN